MGHIHQGVEHNVGDVWTVKMSPEYVGTTLETSSTGIVMRWTIGGKPHLREADAYRNNDMHWFTPQNGHFIRLNKYRKPKLIKSWRIHA